MADGRKAKRQRFSLGGPAVDTSFEEYLTGSTRHISSSPEGKEEESDQENQDPKKEKNDLSSSSSPTASNPLENDHNNDDNQQPTLQTSTDRFFIQKIYSSARNLKPQSPQSYLLHLQLLFPDSTHRVSRILCLPSTSTLETLSQAILTLFHYTGHKLHEFILRKPPPPLEPIGDEILAIRNKSSRHVLGTESEFPTHLRAKRVRLFDLWDVGQDALVKKLELFFQYGFDRFPRSHRVCFLGVGDRGLRGGHVGVADFDQGIWCLDGQGAMVSEHLDEGEYVMALPKDAHKWDIGEVNRSLSKIKPERVEL